MKEPQLLTTPQAAKLTGMSVSWLQASRSRGNGPPFLKIGRVVRYQRAELLEWFAGHRQVSTGKRQAVA
jgi:predicted DNA-binding transcriptional regulator AlpA